MRSNAAGARRVEAYARWLEKVDRLICLYGHRSIFDWLDDEEQASSRRVDALLDSLFEQEKWYGFPPRRSCG